MDTLVLPLVKRVARSIVKSLAPASPSMNGWDSSVLHATLVPLLDAADRANVVRCCKAWRDAFTAGLQELPGVKSMQALAFVSKCRNLRLLDLHAASPLPHAAGQAPVHAHGP